MIFPNLNFHQKQKCKVRRTETNLYEIFHFNLDELDESGIDFVKKCIQVIERRGLNEQGLYRVVGMQSKVNSIVTAHFGRYSKNSSI